MIYFVIFGVISIFALCTDVLEIKEFVFARNTIFIVLSVMLIFFAGTRTNTGYDFMSYKIIFEDMAKLEFDQIWTSGHIKVVEAGYLIINFCFKWANYQTYIFILAAISITLKVTYIFLNCKRKILCLLCYYGMYMCTYDMGIMRQGLAISICLWAYRAYIEKRYKKFIGLISIASCIHLSSLILLMLFLIKDRKYSTFFYLAVVLFSFGFADMNSVIKVLSILPIPYVQEKLWLYSHNASNLEILFSVLKRCFIFVVFLNCIKWEKISKYSKKGEITYLNALYLSIIVSLIMSAIPIFGGRGTGILQLAQIFIFPLLLDNRYCIYKVKNQVVCKLLCYILIVCWSLYSLYTLVNTHDYLPYKHI